MGKFPAAESTENLLERVAAHLRVSERDESRGEIVAWCEFHDDGNGIAPHQANLNVSIRGFYCHACGAKGSLRDLAEKLGIPSCTSGKGETTYDYRDINGQLLYQVVRAANKRFYQRRPHRNGGWIKNLKGVTPTLYRFPELQGNVNAVVYVVEGEKDADRLATLDLLATTNSGGAGKWRKDYAKLLKGRKVIILPDNDQAGRAHAQKVAQSLVGDASSIKLVELPDLPEKGDVSDWLDAGGTHERLLQLSEAAHEYEAPSVNGSQPDDPDDDDDTDDPSGHSSVASQLVELVLQKGVELFHDEREEPYARILAGSRGRLIAPLKGRTFQQFLAYNGFRDMGRALGGEVLVAATRTLSAFACFDCPEHQLHVRLAWHEESIWIDMDGRRAIKVSPGEWAIIEEPPILFRSYSHQEPMPEPIPGGNPTKVFNHLNLPKEETQLLYLGFLVAALVPDIPVPALIAHGAQGAAKTTLLKVTKRLLDPSRVEVRGGAKDLTEYAQAAAQNRMLVFDNLTSIPDWLSDALCRTVTGDGFSKRTLFTDDDATILEIQSVIGITGINNVATRADLLDRSLIVELDPISPESRREDLEFWKLFEADRAEIFGGLLDLLATAMEIHPTLRLSAMPRMADAVKWGTAVAVALGRTTEDFERAYSENEKRQTEAALDESAVAQVVLQFMSNREEWSGKPTELLAELRTVADSERIDVGSRVWPKTAAVLSRRLNESRPTLVSHGIRFHRSGGECRKIELVRVAANSVNAVSSVKSASLNHLGASQHDDFPDNVGRFFPVDVVRPVDEGDVFDPGSDDNDDDDDSCGESKGQDECA